MRRIIIFVCALLCTISCSTYDYESILEQLRDHEERIQKLESLCNKLNSNIEAMQAVLTALEQNDYVTDVVKVVENGIEVGYSITFAKGGTVTIYHGSNGADGAAPKVSIRKAADGEYYWTADGEWMTDDEGNMIPAVVADDPNGEYITPQFRVADGKWYVSYDGGNTWQAIEGASTENGANDFFQSVSYDDKYVYITLNDGTEVKIPRDGIESEKTKKVTLTAAAVASTISGYVLPSQNIGQPVTFGTHSSSYMFIIPAGAQVHIEPTSGGSYGFALCDSNDNVIEYTTNAAKYTFEKQYCETHLWASAPKLGNTYYTITYKEPESNYWTGKTIWWCGTSIPAGGYPQIAGEMLGANVINTATGGSMCRANVRTGDYNGVNISNITSSLSMTLEEVESFISNYATIRQLDMNGNLPATLDDSYIKRIRQGSFEVKLMPYLDGTKPMPDLWIIDHGHNDWKYRDSKGQIDIALEPTRANIDSGELAEDTYMTETINGVPYARLQSYLGSFENIDPAKLDDFVCSLNRNCYYGSLNFITTLILVHNPRARFMMIGNYSNEHSGETGYAALIPAQKAWAADWCFPFCDVASCLGTSQHIIPGTSNFFENYVFHYDTNVFHIYCPDGVHPSSDSSKHALEIYAGIVTEFIKQHR